jgi:hypothetical protein
MPDYRIYTLAEGGYIAWAPEVVDCANDSAAIEQAKKMLDGHPIQIWDGPRLVFVLNPDHAALWGVTPVFEPDVSKAMGEAYDTILEELAKGGHTQIGKDVLASRIIALARNGERNPDRIARLILEGHA